MGNFKLIIFLTLQFILIHGTDIEGLIITPSGASPNWAAETKVRVDGNRYFGFVKPDGSFVISDVEPGSYLVEFTNPTYLFPVSHSLALGLCSVPFSTCCSLPIVMFV